jgi:cell wall-associated NlpC family hydrolase
VSRRRNGLIVAALVLVAIASPVTGRAQARRSPAGATDSLVKDSSSDANPGFRAVIERHLGRPYVWGATGLKSFDCSGFVWRVMQENGIFIKRSTARKYFLTLPKAPEDRPWEFGDIVFFSNLKHCGIVQTPETFYHAAVSVGTHVSRFDPFWRRKVTGVRVIPALRKTVVAEPPAK